MNFQFDDDDKGIAMAIMNIQVVLNTILPAAKTRIGIALT